METLSKLHAGTLKQPKSHQLSAYDDDDDECVTDSFSVVLSEWTAGVVCLCFCSTLLFLTVTLRLSTIASWYLQSTQVKRTPEDSIREYIIRKLNTLVVEGFRFISTFWGNCLRSNFIHSKVFNLTKYREVLVQYNHCSLRLLESWFKLFWH